MQVTGLLDTKYAGISAHVQEVLGQNGSHGMEHVMRVVRLCELIGTREHADMDILIPAALLHDIARPDEKALGIPHEIRGAGMAEDYLSSIGYREDLVTEIARAIRTHRYRSVSRPESLEARILSDADKIDAMGAVGIARTFMRAAEHGGTIDDAVSHFHDKLLRLRGMMYTETARQIAEGRHELLVRFLGGLEDELGSSTE